MNNLLSPIPSEPRGLPLPDALLDALAQRGPSPALTWYGPEGRTELSGRVLSNWIIKAINHLSDEVGISEGDRFVLDLPSHWKRLVLAIAGWSLGAEVTCGRGQCGNVAHEEIAPRSPSMARGNMEVAATDNPLGQIAAQAHELIVLEATALSLRAPGPLPPLAHDWAQELLAAGDVLSVPVGPWSGPTVAVAAGPNAPVLITDDGADNAETASHMLAQWCAGSRVIGPAHALDEAARRSEGLDEHSL